MYIKSSSRRKSSFCLALFILAFIDFGRVTGQFTLEDVALHTTPEDCWSAIYEQVWSLNVYAPNHPGNGGGGDTVYLLCGIEGTSLYETFHGNNPQYLDQMVGIEFHGALVTDAPTVFPSESPTSSFPTLGPTNTPTVNPPSESPTSSSPTLGTTNPPTTNPSTTSSPTIVPTKSPSNTPITKATEYPTVSSPLASSIPPTDTPTSELSDDRFQLEVSNAVVVSKEELMRHNSVTDCWVCYFGECYDVTDYAPTHPGGASLVTGNCGHDDTESYSIFHDYVELQTLRPYFVGALNDGSGQEQQMPLQLLPSEAEPESESEDDAALPRPSTPAASGSGNTSPQGGGAVALDELRSHNSVNDCWVSYFGECYDVTEYAPTHPGGSSIVTANCGHDDTESFSIFHNYKELEDIRPYFKGMLQTQIANQPSSAPQTGTSPQPGDTSSAGNNNGMVSFAQLQQHSTPDDCWVSYFGEVYNMKSYAPQHPAGSETITNGCGKDDTKQYEIFHERSLLIVTKQHYIGQLDTSTVAATPDMQPPRREPVGMMMEDVAAHDNPGSCYVRYFNDVYDLTYYSHPSPPGQSFIYLGCGKDSTRDFASAHPKNLLDQVAEFRVGWIQGSASSAHQRLSTGMTTTMLLVVPLLSVLV